MPEKRKPTDEEIQAERELNKLQSTGDKDFAGFETERTAGGESSESPEPPSTSEETHPDPMKIEDMTVEDMETKELMQTLLLEVQRIGDVLERVLEGS